VLDSVPSNPTNTPVAGFIFHGIDTGTGVARFECALDAASFASCASGVSYGGLTAGSHTFSVRAIDAAGNIDATPAGYVWTVDTTGPLVTVPADFLAEATGPAGAIVTFTVTAVDAVDGAVPVTCAPASGGTFAFGETTVSCTATDRLGNSGRGSFRVTVADTKAPVLTLPGNITVEAGSANGAKVSYSASAVDLVDGAVSVVCTPASGSSFPLGVTNVHCVTADRRGNTASGDFTVTVRDTTAPTIFAVLSVPTILFPADGKMKPVTVLALAADSVSAVTCRITAITGNDGATSDDWQITGRLTANLRARHSPHAIRLYSLTVGCSDATGNASTTTAFVVVP
jgi:hypothetical protein